MHIDFLPLSDITPYANDPRRNSGAMAIVKASIQEFGFRHPLVVEIEGVIVCGHTRYKAGSSSFRCMWLKSSLPAQSGRPRINLIAEQTARRLHLGQLDPFKPPL